MISIRIRLLLLALLALSGCASVGPVERLRFEGLESTPRQLSGVLRLPRDKPAPVPVVILVHGTAGVDSRYHFHRPALLNAGIGTFEVDFKTGVFTSGTNRPPMVTFLPWAFGALKALRADPRVDARHIAIMGFSLGGHVSVAVASRKVTDRWLGAEGTGFAAHVGFYPVCKALSRYFDQSEPTGAPILIITGEQDSWGDGQSCPGFCNELNASRPDVVALTIYPGVHHGFDRRGSWTGFAPYATNQTATLQWNAEAAHDSRDRAVAFLRHVFGL